MGSLGACGKSPSWMAGNSLSISRAKWQRCGHPLFHLGHECLPVELAGRLRMGVNFQDDGHGEFQRHIQPQLEHRQGGINGGGERGLAGRRQARVGTCRRAPWGLGSRV